MDATFMLTGTWLLLGAAGGVWGLFTVWEQKRKQQPAPQPDAMTIEKAIERAMSRKPQWEAELTQALANRPAPVTLDMPTPDWVKEWAEDARLANDRVVAAVRQPKPQPELERMLIELVRIGAKLDELLATPPAHPVDEFLELQNKLVQRIAAAVEPLTDLPMRLGELASKIRSSTGSSVNVVSGPPITASGSGNGGVRRLPPAQRATPRAAPIPNMATPSIPAPYVGGSIVVPAGVASNLFTLIQQQLAPNCSGSPAELVISADDTVFVGAASMLGGPLSDTNYAFQLTAGIAPRIYRSSFPGNSAPLADLQVFAEAGAVVHVEVTT